jgi:deoxyribodipyrimidine photo-lyase
MSKGLFIFRRDFRTTDNTTLIELSKNVDKIIPLFIVTIKQVDKNVYKSSNSIQFMYESLRDLNKNLRNKLVVCFGENDKIIEQILKNNKDITYVGFNLDYTPYAKKRDEKIEKICDRYNVKTIIKEDYTLIPSYEVRESKESRSKNAPKEYYSVFNPFYQKMIKKDIPKPNSKKINFSSDIKIQKKTISILEKYFKQNNNVLIHGGRKNALGKLKGLGKFKNYDKTRNLPQYNTTLLSAYIKYGCVSIREVYHAMVKKVGKNSELTRQLIWHDFYAFIMMFIPEKQTIGGSNFKNKIIKWTNNKKDFEDWCEGNTGIPIIDASMRQLNLTGWMHNRCRLLVSNFLTKKLKIDWHWGEKYFATKLIDYDVASNNLNWQWSSGVGTDRIPYERIYNPFRQTKEIDPDCIYIKKYVQELKNVDNDIILNWDKMYDRIDIDYPEPIIF